MSQDQSLREGIGFLLLRLQGPWGYPWRTYLIIRESLGQFSQELGEPLRNCVHFLWLPITNDHKLGDLKL